MLRMQALPCVSGTVVLAILAGGCGSDWALDVTVRFSARRQSEYDAYPAQVVVLTDGSAEAAIAGPEGRALRIANLCSAQDSDFTAQLTLSGDDCSQLPRYVQAWIERRDPDAESRCGALDEPVALVGLRHPPADSPQAEALVFEGQGADCEGKSAAVTLNLDW